MARSSTCCTAVPSTCRTVPRPSECPIGSGYATSRSADMSACDVRSCASFERRLWVSDRGEELPALGNTLEGVGAPVHEVEGRADEQVLDGTSGEHLARLCECAYSRADVYGETVDVVAAKLYLPCMDPDARLETDAGADLDVCRGASQGEAGNREDREYPITGRVD